MRIYSSGRSCTYNIFVIRQLSENHREFNNKTYILFVNYRKAFDRVGKEKLRIILQRRDIPQHLIALITSMYDNWKVCTAGNENKRINKFRFKARV